MKRSKIAAYFLVLTVLATVLLPTGAVHAKIIGSGTALSSVNGVFDAEAEDLPFDDDYLGLSTEIPFPTAWVYMCSKKIRHSPQSATQRIWTLPLLRTRPVHIRFGYAELRPRRIRRAAASMYLLIRENIKTQI